MKTYKQLSKAQKRVIDLLLSDKDSYCSRGIYYDFQNIILPNKSGFSTWCCKPTLEYLIKHNVLVLSNYVEDMAKGHFVLNPNFKKL